MEKKQFWRSPSRLLTLAGLIFILIIFVLGVFTSVLKHRINENDLAQYNGEAISFSGRVCEEADVDYKSRRLTICVAGADKIEGKVLVTASLYPIYDYGDYLEVSGELKPPPIIEGFDYESYLARFDIYSVMYYAKIKKIDGILTWPQVAYLKLIQGKQFLKSVIDCNLPEPQAGLADALLFGYRRTVMRSDLDVFARVGLSHMIAISGSHITILSAMAMNFLLALGFCRRRSLKIIFVFLFIYPLITGLSASAVRSALMGALAFLAIYYERLGSMIRALVLAAVLMLVFNPRLLRDDIGFQLSFLALLGIIYIYPMSEELTRRILEKRKWRAGAKRAIKNILDTVNLTIVSQIVILPIALIDFGQFSAIAPLANILVLWIFAPLLAALILGILGAAIIPPLGVLFMTPSYLLLKYIYVASEILARPGWAAIEVSGFNWYEGLAYYFCLAAAVVMIRRFFRK